MEARDKSRLPHETLDELLDAWAREDEPTQSSQSRNPGPPLLQSKRGPKFKFKETSQSELLPNRTLRFSERTYQAERRPSRHADGRPITPPELPVLKIETAESTSSSSIVEEFRRRPESQSCLSVTHVDGKVIIKTDGLTLRKQPVIVPDGRGWQVQIDLDSLSLGGTPVLSRETTPLNSPNRRVRLTPSQLKRGLDG